MAEPAAPGAGQERAAPERNDVRRVPELDLTMSTPVRPYSIPQVTLALALSLVIAPFALPALSSDVIESGKSAAPTVREEHVVNVRNVKESWRLEWIAPPVPDCDAGDPAWFVCPCYGFAFGERGNLDLVRLREGHEVERLSLTPSFDNEYPGLGRQAVLRRWDVREDDFNDRESPDFVARVRRRPIVGVMNIADYNHDGWISEFPLQVGTAPCGKQMAVLVGVSRAQDRLHIFGTASHPDTPFVLRMDHWLALRDSHLPLTRLDWACGDHGSETETDVELNVEDAGIRVTRREFKCTANGRRGDLIRETQE